MYVYCLPSIMQTVVRTLPCSLLMKVETIGNGLTHIWFSTWADTFTAQFGECGRLAWPEAGSCSIIWMAALHSYAANGPAWPHVLWAVNMQVSMPVAANVHFYPAWTCLLTGLCGDCSPVNNCVKHCCSLRELIFCKISFKVVIMHTFHSPQDAPV